MKFNSTYHGEINYEEKDIISFQNGIPGFEKLKKFILLKLPENDNFNILHSIDDENIGLILTNPYLFDINYEVDIPEGITSHLKIENPKQVLIYTTVTLNSNISKITSNFKAPIIINKDFKIGEQYIIDSAKYSIRYPLFKEKE